MRIGVDGTCWHNRRGYGRHSRALLRSLVRQDRSNEYTLLLDSALPAERLPEGCKVRVVPSSVPTVQAASAEGRRSLADLWRMSQALSAPDFDLILFPTIYSYVPVWAKARKLVMVHDVIAETYPQLTVPRRTARFFWNAKSLLGRWQADALVTVSEFARQGIVERFGLDRSRVFVVGEAAEPVFRKLERPQINSRLAGLGIDGRSRLVVYLGGFSPHKNLEALVDSFAQIARREDFTDVRLVMVGDNSGDAFFTYCGTITDRVKELGLQDRVIFTGFFADEDLVVLLNLATVLVLPSLMEGFGLPAVEAAACGCPVIATKASPLPQLLNGGGIFIEPGRDQITAALLQVLSSSVLRNQLAQAAFTAAGRLTWDAAADQMMNVIRTMAARG